MAKKTPEKISDLIPDEKNFNKHTEYGTSLLEKSLRKFGAGRSILIDKNNKIIAGNGITESAVSVGLEDIQVIETDGKKLIAVKRTDIDLDSNMYSAPPQRNNEFSTVHAATFPIHLPSFIISSLMNLSAGVVDCFMGTGTTIIAAEQLGRKAYGIEISPNYCDIIVARYITFMQSQNKPFTIKRNGAVLSDIEVNGHLSQIKTGSGKSNKKG